MERKKEVEKKKERRSEKVRWACFLFLVLLGKMALTLSDENKDLKDEKDFSTEKLEGKKARDSAFKLRNWNADYTLLRRERESQRQTLKRIGEEDRKNCLFLSFFLARSLIQTRCLEDRKDKESHEVFLFSQQPPSERSSTSEPRESKSLERFTKTSPKEKAR